jgi:hypothetical protein
VPLAAQVRGELHRLSNYPAERGLEVERALVRRGGTGETGRGQQALRER